MLPQLRDWRRPTHHAPASAADHGRRVAYYFDAYDFDAYYFDAYDATIRQINMTELT